MDVCLLWVLYVVR